MTTDLIAVEVGEQLTDIADELDNLERRGRDVDRIRQAVADLVDAIYPREQPIEVWSALRQIKAR